MDSVGRESEWETKGWREWCSRVAVGEAGGAGVGWGWTGTWRRLGTIWREQTGHQMESKGMSTGSMVSGEGCRGRGRREILSGLITQLVPPGTRVPVILLFIFPRARLKRARSQIWRCPIWYPRLIGRIRHRSDSQPFAEPIAPLSNQSRPRPPNPLVPPIFHHYVLARLHRRPPLPPSPLPALPASPAALSQRPTSPFPASSCHPYPASVRRQARPVCACACACSVLWSCAASTAGPQVATGRTQGSGRLARARDGWMSA